MQSTPQGGLRDRQAAHGEAVSVARRPSWSKPAGVHGARVRDYQSAVQLSPDPRPVCAVPRADPGVVGAGPAGEIGPWCRRGLRLGRFLPARRRAKQPGVEQGEAGRGAAGAGSRPGLGSPSRAAPLAEYLGSTPAAAGCPRSPPGVSEGDGPVLKHGPRSAACMQGERISIPMYRNEHNHRG